MKDKSYRNPKTHRGMGKGMYASDKKGMGKGKGKMKGKMKGGY